MSHTNRPLMGNAVAQNPETVQAQSPSSIQNTQLDPMEASGNPGTVSQETPSHDWEKRYKDLQSYSTKQVNAKDTEIANLLRDKAQGPKFQPPKTAEELTAFRTENPETYAFIQTIAHDMANNQTQVISERLETAESTLAETSREAAMNQLKLAHPDFEEINGHPSFNIWLESQDPEVQSWIYHNTNDANKVSRALSLFKHDTGWGVKENNSGNPNGNQGNQSNLDGSRAVDVQGGSEGGNDPRTHPKYIWSEAEIAKMHPLEFAKYESDISLALSERRVAMG